MDNQEIADHLPFMTKVSEAMAERYWLDAHLPTAHLEIGNKLLELARSKKFRDMIPAASINNIAQALDLDKIHNRQFRKEVRMAIVFFVYAAIEHDRLPGAKRSKSKKKGVNHELVEIADLACDLIQKIGDLVGIPSHLFQEAIYIRGSENVKSSKKAQINNVINCLEAIRSAATLCTTSIEKSRIMRSDSIEYVRIPTDNSEARDVDVLFRKVGSPSNRWQMLVEILDDKSSGGYGYISSRVPALGRSGINEKFVIKPSLVRCIAEKAGIQNLSNNYTLNSNLDQLGLIEELDRIQTALGRRPITFNDGARTGIKPRRDPQEAVSLLLYLIYDFNTEDGRPKKSLVEKLVRRTASRRKASDDQPDITRKLRKQMGVFHTEMLARHLGGAT